MENKKHSPLPWASLAAALFAGKEENEAGDSFVSG